VILARVGLLVLATALVALGAADARAFYGNGATIVSASQERQEQADDATSFAAISGGGRYVAFQTRARNFFADDDPDPDGAYRIGGVFRRDLATGTLETVASGDVRDEKTNDLLRRGAQSPSISADGRYVAFSSAERLVLTDVNDAVDVYVRDMALARAAPGAYELVTAKDGGDVPAAFDPPSPAVPGRNPGGEVTRGAAISADGRRVVFRTSDVESDLPGRPSTDTPGFQVFVRDRQAKTTTLVTRKLSDGTPAGGATGPAGLSADGSTVVWTGQSAPRQTRFLNGEFADDNAFFYLWRRVGDGPAAPTRRITGSVDPEDPACPDSFQVSPSPSATGPCYGPLVDTEGAVASVSSQLPAMSADGRRVVFLTGTGRRPSDNTSGPGLDLWLTDMSPGVSRKAGSIELTREGTGDSAASGPIEAIAMSGDGRYLAIASPRTRYLLPALRAVGAMRQLPDTRELQVVDLQDRTVERATRSSGGGEIDRDVLNALSISGDGGRVAFVAQSTNLFFGDANEQPDAFVVERQPLPVPEPAPPEPPPTPPLVIENPPEPPALVVKVRAGAKGSVRLLVKVPGPGSLAAEAKATLPSRAKSSAKPKKPKKPKPVTLARASAKAKVAGQVTLTLRPAKRYGEDLRRRGSLSALASVVFTPTPAGRRLTSRARVTFRAPARRSKPAKPKRPKDGAAAQRIRGAAFGTGRRMVNFW